MIYRQIMTFQLMICHKSIAFSMETQITQIKLLNNSRNQTQLLRFLDWIRTDITTMQLLGLRFLNLKIINSLRSFPFMFKVEKCCLILLFHKILGASNLSKYLHLKNANHWISLKYCFWDVSQSESINALQIKYQTKTTSRYFSNSTFHLLTASLPPKNGQNLKAKIYIQ